jgi:nucleotide-binding universal stress UspA family protein
MYRRILIPLDGSELAQGVLEYAARIVAEFGMDAILLHVHELDGRDQTPTDQGYIDEAAHLLTQQLRKTRADVPAFSAAAETRIRCVLREGYPAEEIARCATENDVDLILMGTHGRSGIRRWAIGGVAEKVLRASETPVWLHRPSQRPETASDLPVAREILVPLDGSAVAESVLPHVEALARQEGKRHTRVTLLRVSDIPLVPDYYLSYVPLNWDDFVEMCRKRQASAYLAKVEERLSHAAAEVYREVLMARPGYGNPADYIVDYAAQHPCDLIVMSGHGNSGPRRWALGSVADRVLHGASKPVLLVRGTCRASQTGAVGQAEAARTVPVVL